MPVVPPQGGVSPSQSELDLLADGRDYLERWSRSPRFRYLYPDGPNLAILLRAYQVFDRRRIVGRVSPRPRAQARALRRIVLRLAQRDAAARGRRLRWRYPPARLRAPGVTPALVDRALSRVDADARRLVLARVEGNWALPDPASSLGAEAVAEARGLAQFRDALVNEALAHPSELASLHPQFLLFAASSAPLRRRYPIATFVFVTLPLRFVVGVFLLLALLYFGAYAVFNDERLGSFVGSSVSGLLEGELEIGSIHWELRLIVDLVTGTPTHAVVEDVAIWEAYESYGGERKRRTAWAPHLDAHLVLHEIIPWNRIGVPDALEIPWVLHFTEVEAEPNAWFIVREYDDTTDEGETRTLLSLIDAFRTTAPPDASRQGLSFLVDRAQFGQVTIDADFMHEDGGWRVVTDMRELELGLRYDSPHPDSGTPIRLPFRFSGRGHANIGRFTLDDIQVPFADLGLQKVACGMDGVPLGDVGFSAQGMAADSPLSLDGVLADAFTRPLEVGREPLPLDAAVSYGTLAHVDLRAGSGEPLELVRHIEGQLGLAPETIVARDSIVWAEVQGPLSDPEYHLAAEGLALDLLGEPAWTMDDVELSVSLATTPVPLRWEDELPPRSRRLVARFETFRGSAFDGSFALDQEVERGAVVLFPDGDEPYRIAAPLELQGVNPAQLSPDDPEVAKMLAGQADGSLDLDLLEIGPPLPAADADDSVELPRVDDGLGLRVARLTLTDMRLTRDHGPASDGLPRRLRADGTVTIGADGAIDLDDLMVRTDGAELRATGGVDGAFATLKETNLALDISDGRAFSRAFGLDPYFNKLQAKLSVMGPTKAPDGGDGRLVLSGLAVQEGTTTQATMWMNRGVLSINAPRAHLFGGTGSVDADIVLFEHGGITSDPKLRATIELHNVELADLDVEGIAGTADFRIEVGDEDGKPVPLSALQMRGHATIPDLRFGGTHYRNAVVDFALDPEQVSIERLVLPVHRAVSPFRPDVTVPIGQILASGTVGLSDDPELNLHVEAQGVPLRLVARLLEVEVPVRGRIDTGTDLTVTGTVRRPSVSGSVALAGLSAEGIALGSGILEVTSDDVASQGALAAHRELRVSGELDSPSEGDNGGLQWTLDALVALGEAPRNTRGGASALPPIDAEVDVRFDRVALSPLLRGLTRGSGTAPTIMGRLDDLSAHVLTCDPASAMISECGEAHSKRSLEVSLQLGDAWLSGREPTTDDPCQDPVVLCTAGALAARIDGSMIELERPWSWRTGGREAAELSLTGSFDLSAGQDSSASSPASDTCRPPTLASLEVAEPTPGVARAELHGALDLAVIAELLQSDTLRQAQGRLNVNLALDGPVADTKLSGEVTLPQDADGKPEPLALDIGSLGLPLEVNGLKLQVGEQWLSAAGKLRVLGETIDFGAVGTDNTGFAFGGPCEGFYGLAVEGTVGAGLVNEVVGAGTATRGSVDVPRLVLRGDVNDETFLSFAEGTARFGRTSLSLDLDEGLPAVELVDGQVDIAHCAGGTCPPEIREGSLALMVGGRAAAESRRRPSEALRAKLGPRGTAIAWGTAYLVPEFDNVDGTRLTVEIEDVPYRGYDRRGRPVYEAEASSSAISLQGGSPLVVSGSVDVDRARYVQDAVQGVEILRFTEDVDLPSAPPPDIIRDLQFDLRVQTTSPLRVENNIAHGVEADAVVEVTGSYEHPEFTGRVDVEPGGTVDIPFLTGTYEIQRGRVTLLEDLADAEVDILALRQELVYIDDTPRQVALLLGGTASAISWECIAEGDTSGAVDTQRGCLDYLVLGAGDVQDSSLTVQRTGGGGLANARKPLQVVGHVTEFDFGKRIEEAAPRFGPYVPDIRLRLGQIGPELEIATPTEWLDFDYVRGTAALDYTRGYPGFLLQQSRELTFKLEAIDLLVFEVSRDIRSYLNNRIIFDPLRQTTVEFRVDFEIPSLR